MRTSTSLSAATLAASLLFGAPLLGGCAATQKPVVTEAALGRVIIYRNGVAYFERRARIKGDELTITVPAERVDDFLKSLTVQDAATGKSLPISYPTVLQSGDDVEMTIKLPKPVPKELKVSYVTASPAWKPSYRLVLKEGGRARLEAWAVVDNVSGEDWKAVTVGVGSTSALSFKYDLKSVRLVERETLGGDDRVALAPPTGGSPYEVKSGETQVLGNVHMDAVNGLLDGRGSTTGANLEGNLGTKRTSAHKGVAPREEVARGKSAGHAGLGAAPKPEPPILGMAQRALQNKQKVRIEGFARPDEADKNRAAMARANAVRQLLVDNGIPASELEVVANPNASARDGVRLVAVSKSPPQAEQAKATETTSSNDPIGSAYFVAPTPMSIEKNHSAMVSIMTTNTQAEPLYYYDPISARGSRQFAFKAVRFDNPSPYTLDGGPFTVYSDSQFLGEGLSEAIPPKSTAFIPYALDKKILVEPVADTREEVDRLLTIERGIVRTETQRIRRTRFTLVNRGESAAKVIVRHAVPKGWTLRDGKQRAEKLRGAHLFPVSVPARGSVQLEIEESMPFEKTLNINDDDGVKQLALFLESKKRLSPELSKRLDDIVKMHRELRDKQSRIETVHRQMNDYRARVDEIHVQLVTLRRVPNAQTLSRHLAKKMEEISDRLQKATIEVTDLEGQVLSTRIGLEDRLAELTLKDRTAEKLAATP
ncbi:MAG: hypothetical protein R3B13_17945 [Polyangiaceae bacterium]